MGSTDVLTVVSIETLELARISPDTEVVDGWMLFAALLAKGGCMTGWLLLPGMACSASILPVV